jgi:thiol:disulfide interchange protein
MGTQAGMSSSHSSTALGVILVLITTGCLFTTTEDDNQTNRSDDAGSTKLVYYYFYSTTCPACRLMEQTTLSNQTVLDALEANFLFKRINAATNGGLVQKYEVVFVPTSIFTRPDGGELRRVVGAVSPEDFLRLSDEIVAAQKA